jgi:hypothetical protein
LPSKTALLSMFGALAMMLTGAASEAHGQTLDILSAESDASNTLIVKGGVYSEGLQVFVGTTELAIQSIEANEVRATLPELPAGSHLLTVYQPETGLSTRFAMTLGTVGPQGPPGPEGPQGLPGEPGASPAMVVDSLGNVVGQLFATNKVLLKLEAQMIAVTIDRLAFSPSTALILRFYPTADCSGPSYREVSPTAVLREGQLYGTTNRLYYANGPAELLPMGSVDTPNPAAGCVAPVSPTLRFVATGGEFDTTVFVGPFSVQ